MQELTPDQLQKALDFNLEALSRDDCHECGANQTKYWLFKDRAFNDYLTFKRCRNSCSDCTRTIKASIQRELTVKEVFTLKCLRK